jgi:hypothetical protein
MMKTLIISVLAIGLVAVKAYAVNKYIPNDGRHLSGTFTNKPTTGILSHDSGSSTIPNMDVSPETMNTSPNPAPAKGIDYSSYGESVIQPKGLNNSAIQAEEERPINSKPKLKH